MTQEKSVLELLDDLQNIVDALKANLPKEAPLVIPKSTDPKKASHLIDPLRVVHLREACYHRVFELADSGCEALKKGDIVVAYLLMRAVMETLAIFWYFVDHVEKALNYGDMKDLRKILSQMAVGVKSETGKTALQAALAKESIEVEEILFSPVHVLKLIDQMGKTIPAFKDQYEFLCEVAYPNSMGLLKAYVKNDWELGVTYFGKDDGELGSHLPSDIEALIVFLEGFIDLYDQSAFGLENLHDLV